VAKNEIFAIFSFLKAKNRSKKGLNQKSDPNILKIGLWRICKKMSDIGHKSREQIEFEYDTWQLGTKKVKIDFYDRESISIPAFSTR
jgi:hypothetical protein